MDKILEISDLEPISPEPEAPAIGLDSLDLEQITGEDGEGNAEEMGDKDYQYLLTVRQAEDEEGSEENLDPSFTFILTPKEAEGEEEGDLEAIEDTGEDIGAAQAPQSSVPAAPMAPGMPESVWHDLESITEQDASIAAAGGENTPQATGTPPEAPIPAEGEPALEPEGELEEVAPVELSEEDLKSFLEGDEFELKFSIDEETEFSLEEAIDYLQLYPDTEIFVTVRGDLEGFKTKLNEFLEGKESATLEAGTEDQNVMVDDSGETLDMANTPANPAQSPSVPRESFSVFNFRNKKNLPDGIYIGHLAESKLYGRIDLKLTSNKLVIGKDVFALEEKLDIAESREKEAIKLVLEESDVENLVKILVAKADIVVKL